MGTLYTERVAVNMGKRKEELKEGKIFIYPPASSSSKADIDHTSVVERRGWRQNPRAWQLNQGALLSSPH